YFSKIFMGDIDQMGIKNTKEPLFKFAKESGTLVKAIEEHPELLDADGNYVTFEKGINVLTDRLTKELEDVIQYNQRVTEIKPSIEGTYILDINHKQQVRVGAVCVATGASIQPLFSDEKLKKWFTNIHLNAGSVGYLLFSFPKGSILRQPKGFGVLTPRRSDSYIRSITLLNKKWPFYGDNEEYVGVSFGRVGENFLMSLSNKQLEEYILKELQAILHISASPVYRVVKRWPESIPQHTIHHDKNLDYIASYLKKIYPGVYLAGNSFDGYGTNQCIRQASIVSKKAVEYVKSNNSN